MATISGISSLDPSSQSTSSTDPRNTLRQLFAAVKSGDLPSAQQAYAALTKNSQAGPLTSSTLGEDFAAIGAALKSGDVSGAQQALTKLKDDLETAVQAHKHHHGHHHHGARTVAATDASSTTAPDPNDPASLIGATLSVKA